jgi:hypothetical protein
VKIRVIFDPQGHVASVKTGEPFKDNEVGQCIERTFLGIRVPAFKGSSVAAPKTFKIP